MVESRTFNPLVVGSSPTGGTKPGRHRLGFFSNYRMTHENFKHLKINYRDYQGYAGSVEQRTELLGGLRSLIAMFPEKNTHIATTSYGVYRCRWNDDEKHWDIELIAYPKENEVSSIFV